MKSYSLLAFVLLAPVAAGLMGCGSGGGASVSGTVTYQGQPLPVGTVSFTGKEGGASAVITNGAYSVTNLPEGEMKVTVSTPMPSASPPPGVKAIVPAVQPIAVPQKYRSPDHSGLSYAVESGSHEHDITLQ